MMRDKVLERETFRPKKCWLRERDSNLQPFSLQKLNRNAQRSDLEIQSSSLLNEPLHLLLTDLVS
jgi:hypothetical protein